MPSSQNWPKTRVYSFIVLYPRRCPMAVRPEFFILHLTKILPFSTIFDLSLQFKFNDSFWQITLTWRDIFKNRTSSLVLIMVWESIFKIMMIIFSPTKKVNFQSKKYQKQLFIDSQKHFTSEVWRLRQASFFLADTEFTKSKNNYLKYRYVDKFIEA